MERNRQDLYLREMQVDSHPRSVSANPHSVGADMGSEISTPRSVTVAIWNYSTHHPISDPSSLSSESRLTLFKLLASR